MAKLLKDMDEPTLRHYINGLGQALEYLMAGAEFPPTDEHPAGRRTCCFALFIYDESNIGHYVSNAARPEMIKILRETADRIERNQDLRREHD